MSTVSTISARNSKISNKTNNIKNPIQNSLQESKVLDKTFRDLNHTIVKRGVMLYSLLEN